MSACWIGASISYQPHGIDQVIVGHDGRIEDMERTVVPKNKNGEHLHGTMKVQCTMTTTTAMIWVLHPNLLVEDMAPNITAVLQPNPLVEEVAASTTAATLVRQQTVQIGTHQEIHGKRIGVLRIGVQIHGMRTRPMKIPQESIEFIRGLLEFTTETIKFVRVLSELAKAGGRIPHPKLCTSLV